MAEADPIAEQLAREIAALDEQIAALAAKRERCAAALRALAGESALTAQNNSDTEENMRQMQALERLRHSKPPHKKSDDKGARERVRRFLDACHKQGHTMSDAATALSTKREKVHQAQLSSALRGKRVMWMPLAKRIEERYGYAATKDNWPDLRKE